jgi:hypothetical protein
MMAAGQLGCHMQVGAGHARIPDGFPSAPSFS